jgi:hypothetical protein
VTFNYVSTKKMIIVAFLLISTLPAGVFADPPWSCGSSQSRLQNGLSQLEQIYVQDCQDDLSPHGYYGAFFQPCEFSFFKSADHTTTTAAASKDNLCSPDLIVGTNKPVHWLFKLQEHINKVDWDELTSKDIPDWDDLMLWPDQCVGVAPRCYSIRDDDMASVPRTSSTDIKKALQSLLPDEIPDEATHVQVDCRSDAMELSRVAFSVGSGLQKGLAFLIAMILLVFLLIMVALSFCCCACFRICFPPRQAREAIVPIYHVVPAETEHVNDGVSKSLLTNEGLQFPSSKHYQAIAV